MATQTKKTGVRIIFNAPVIISFALLCLIAQVLAVLLGPKVNGLVFSVYRASLADPLTYVRAFLHVLGHSGWDHLLNNMMLLLVVGPMMEEKYGPKPMILLIVITALATGIFHCLISANTALLGASGVVFALILLASFTGAKEGAIPVTVIIVALLYIGEQVFLSITDTGSNVSYLAHIVGGIVGLTAGFVLQRKTPAKKK